MQKRTYLRFCHTGGFSLVEVMVSVLVLAVGVLGAAAMQLGALRTSQQSGLHTSALHLASDLADRIRVNIDQMGLDDGLNPFIGAEFDGTEPDPAAATFCYAMPCDGADLAAFDMYEWQRRLATSLPGARAVICRDSSPWDDDRRAYRWTCDDAAGSAVVIKIGWQGKNPDGSAVADAQGELPPAIALIVAPYAE